MKVERLISQGETAEVYDYADGKVLKLFKEGIPHSWAEYEYNIAFVISNLIDFAPKVYEIMTIEDRKGIVYEKAKGNSMVTFIQKKPWLVKKYGKKLADSHISIHKHIYKNNYMNEGYTLPTNIERCTDAILNSSEISSPQKEEILNYTQKLPIGNHICRSEERRVGKECRSRWSPYH